MDWAAILGLIAKIFGLTELAAKFYEAAQNKKAGQEAQERKDLEQALRDDKDAQKTREDVSGLSNAELDDELRRPSTPSNS